MIKKKVWVANRDNPIADSSGNLTIDGEGKLKLTFNGGSIRLPFYRMMAILHCESLALLMEPKHH